MSGDGSSKDFPPFKEEGVEVPYEQLEPETLQNLIEEFVSRDGNDDWGEAGGAFEDKRGQAPLKSGDTIPNKGLI